MNILDKKQPDSTADIASFDNLKNNCGLSSLTLIREMYKNINRT